MVNISLFSNEWIKIPIKNILQIIAWSLGLQQYAYTYFKILTLQSVSGIQPA